MNVLMVGLDDSMFPGGKESNTVIRLGRYLEALRRIEPDSTLTNLVFTQRRVRPIAPQNGLRFIPVRSPRVQLFPITGLLDALRLRHYLRPDIITAQDPLETGLLGLALKQVFKAPLEVQVHFNLLSSYWLAEHRWWNRGRLVLARFILTHADGVRVVSSPLKRALMETWDISGERIAAIPVPVFYDSPPEMPIYTALEILSDPHSKVVLFVGRLCHSKNLPGLFKVIEKVLDARPDVEFVLVGDGPESAYAQKRAAALDSQRAHLAGNVPYTDLPRYYRGADVLVLPSLHEGFGRVVLESYLFETPVIATRCGGPEDIIVDGETGFLTEIEDIEGLADRALWLLDHPDKARRMGARGHEHVRQRFQPGKMIEQMTQQWRQLVK